MSSRLIKFKKPIVFFLIFTITSPVIFLALPTKSVHAFWGIGDIVIDVWQMKDTLIKWMNKSWWNQIVKPMLLRRMTNDVVSWVQGGGKPKFVTNWKDFLGGAADEAGLIFLNELTGINWCDKDWGPLFQLYLKKTDLYAERAKCTLTDLFKDMTDAEGNPITLDDYYNDFRKGSWKAWLAANDPRNDFYTSLLMSMDEKSEREGEAREEALLTAQSGQGFADRECIEYNPDVCLHKDLTTGNCLQYACNKYITRTPGGVISDIVAKSLGYDLDWLVSADNPNEYARSIATILNALLNRTLKEGLAKLQPGQEETGPKGPRVNIISPKNNQKYPMGGSCKVYIRAVVASQTNKGIERVEFYAGERVIEDIEYQEKFTTATTTDFIWPIDTSGYADTKKIFIPISVMAYDEDKNVGSDSVFIKVKKKCKNEGPVAIINGPSEPVKDDDRNGIETIALRGDESFDPDYYDDSSHSCGPKGIGVFEWILGDQVVQSGSNPFFTHTYSLGTHTVKLKVYDCDGASDEATFPLVVSDVQEYNPPEEESGQ